MKLLENSIFLLNKYQKIYAHRGKDLTITIVGVNARYRGNQGDVLQRGRGSL